MKPKIIVLILFVIFLIPAVSKAVTTEDKLRFKDLYNGGFESYKQNKYKEAAVAWEEALGILNTFKENKNILVLKEGLLLNIGEAYRELTIKEKSNDEKASIYFSKALEKYNQIEKAGFIQVKPDTIYISRGLLYGNWGKRFSDKGRYKEAEEYHKKALDELKKIDDGNPKNRDILARAHHFMGETYKYRGKYEESLRQFKNALGYWEKLNKENEKIKEELNIALVLVDKGELLNAGNKFKELNKIIGKKEGVPTGTMLLNWAKCDFILGEYQEAKEKFKKARIIFKNEAYKRGLDFAYNNLGILSFEEGYYEEAVDYFKKVSGADEQIKAIANSNLGMVYLNLYRERRDDGNRDNARDFLKKAIKLSGDVGDSRTEMAALNNLGNLRYEAGLYKSAEEKLKKAREIAVRIRDKEMAQLYEFSDIESSLGDTYLKLNPPFIDGKGGAIERYNSALKNAKALKAKDQKWYAYYGLGKAYKAQGEYKKAQGEDKKAQEDYDKAIGNYKEAIKVIESMRNFLSGSGSIGFLRNKHQVYTELIDLLLERWGEQEKDESKKTEYSKQAFEYLERSRLGAIKSLFEQAIPPEKEETRQELVQINLELTNLRLKMAASRDSKDEKEKSRLEAKIKKLEGEKKAAVKQLVEYDPLIQKQEVVLGKVKEAMADKQVILSFYYNDKNVYRWELNKKSLILKRLGKSHKKNYRVTVESSRYDGKYRKRIKISKEHLYNFDQAIEEIYGIVSDSDKESRNGIKNKQTLQQLLKSIFKSLFVDMENKIKNKDYALITVIPYGKLFKLPFSILITDSEKNGKRLSDYCAVNYYFSVSQQLLPAKKGGDKLFAVGNPEIPIYIRRKKTKEKVEIKNMKKEALNILHKIDGLKTEKSADTADVEVRGLLDGGFKPLSAANKEVDAIGKLFKKKAKNAPELEYSQNYDKPKEITEETVKNALEKGNNYSYLHFATHGKLMAKSPLNSFLVFSENKEGEKNATNSENSGLLTVKEIRQDFFGKLLNTRLAVLSACETSLSGDANGLEMSSLSGSFQSAGVNSVIASLWEVSSNATEMLMESFYNNLLSIPDISIAEALQKAKNDLRKKNCPEKSKKEGGDSEVTDCEYSHEYYWSAFILLGLNN